MGASVGWRCSQADPPGLLSALGSMTKPLDRLIGMTLLSAEIASESAELRFSRCAPHTQPIMNWILAACVGVYRTFKRMALRAAI